MEVRVGDVVVISTEVGAPGDEINVIVEVIILHTMKNNFKKAPSQSPPLPKPEGFDQQSFVAAPRDLGEWPWSPPSHPR